MGYNAASEQIALSDRGFVGMGRVGTADGGERRHKKWREASPTLTAYYQSFSYRSDFVVGCNLAGMTAARR